MNQKTELTDGHILLRPFHSSDIDALFEAATESIDEVYPWLPWCHPGYTRGESANWVKWCKKTWTRGYEYNFAITEAESGNLIGGAGLNQINRMHNFANLGYWVRTGHTRHGVATSATRLLARFAFAELKIKRIEILVAVGNHASMRVAEKAGATREGTLRHRIAYENQMLDAVLYSLLPEDLSTD